MFYYTHHRDMYVSQYVSPAPVPHYPDLGSRMMFPHYPDLGSRTMFHSRLPVIKEKKT
jgi:hypothetical protein